MSSMFALMVATSSPFEHPHDHHLGQAEREQREQRGQVHAMSDAGQPRPGDPAEEEDQNPNADADESDA
jgi:hypothetical protein